MSGTPKDPREARWLLLIHQIPPKPNYFRVKNWRRLQRIGAVAIKNSVYALPQGDAAQEDFQWMVREIGEGGGEASVCEARFVDGLLDEQVEALFHAARDADYAQLAADARGVAGALPRRGTLTEAQRARLEGDLARLKHRLGEIVAIDFLGAPGRVTAEGLVTGLAERLCPQPAQRRRGRPRLADYRRRTWVTRKGIHIDRMGCAWLIRRFIDPEARFKLVPGRAYRPEPDEVRFDMFEAEFTHEEDRCSMEVLLQRLELADPALRPIAEIVHDVDLKDAKFGRPEAAGIAALIAGIAMAHRDDEARLSRGAAVFDDLYEYDRKKRDGAA